MKKLIIKDNGRMVRILDGKSIRTPSKIYFDDKNTHSIENLMRVQSVKDFIIEDCSIEEYQKYIIENNKNSKKSNHIGGGGDINLNLSIGGSK